MNKKTKIFIIGREGLGWAIDENRKNLEIVLEKISEVEIVKNVFAADIVWCTWSDYLARPDRYVFFKMLRAIKKVKIVNTIANDVIQDPGFIHRIRKITDLFNVYSQSMEKFIKSLGHRAIILPSSIDRNIFKRLEKSQEELAELAGIKMESIRDKFLIGSFQRDSLGSDLHKPKWQKNPELLVEILSKLPKDKFILLLAGPRRHYLIHRCQELKIPYLFLGNENHIADWKDDITENSLSLEKVNVLYNLVDLYMVTSKSEGRPKAVLECARTKTLVFSTEVGLAPDILSPNLIFKDNNPDLAVNKIMLAMESPENFKTDVAYDFKYLEDSLEEKNIVGEFKKFIQEV